MKKNWFKRFLWLIKKKSKGLHRTKKFKLCPKKYPISRGFFDMDGTLARFYDFENCLEAMKEKGFYENLGVHEKMLEEFLRFASIYGVENTFIISACIDTPYCMPEKLAWIEKNIPIQLPKENIILVPCGVPKTDYVPDGVTRRDVLYDDYGYNLLKWAEAGGTPVKAINPINDSTQSWKGYVLLCD